MHDLQLLTSVSHLFKYLFAFKKIIIKKSLDQNSLPFQGFFVAQKSPRSNPPSGLNLSFADVRRFFSPEKGKSPGLTLDQLPCTAQCLSEMFVQIHPSETGERDFNLSSSKRRTCSCFLGQLVFFSSVFDFFCTIDRRIGFHYLSH